jgi:hypothetical protein
MVSETQSEQPHWVTPVVTVTPRLEQELRLDFDHEDISGGYTVWNLDGGKGVEVIPAKRIELIFNLPPYFTRNNPKTPGGWGDIAWLVKFRIASGNEQHGNYIVTAFLAGSYDTGTYKNGARGPGITPTIAAGKGFGRFDVQSTLGILIPTANTIKTGHQVAFNNALQYHVAHYFWPEVESNTTWFNGGDNKGQVQSFLTPGVNFGRFPIHNRIGLTLGIGEQIAITHFDTYNHNLVLTARLPF